MKIGIFHVHRNGHLRRTDCRENGGQSFHPETLSWYEGIEDRHVQDYSEFPRVFGDDVYEMYVDYVNMVVDLDMYNVDVGVI